MTSTRRASPVRLLARAVGVADAYEASGRPHVPPDGTLRAVLTELGHECATDDDARRSLRTVRRQPWIRDVAPVAVVWRSDHPDTDAVTRVTVSAPVGHDPDLALWLEDGTRRALPVPVWGGVADTAAGRRRRGTVALPAGLPLGYHRLSAHDGENGAVCTVIVAPARARSVSEERRWGWMLQAYAVRSGASWGQGEFVDVGALAEWAAGDGADFLLINPLHATAPVIPQQPSPYSPTSRRFTNPCYLHVPDVEGFATLASEGGWWRERLPDVLGPDSPRIDRDAIWRAKRAALWALYQRGPATEADARVRLADFREVGGEALQRFATFCALSEEHGDSFADWPIALRDPRSDAVSSWAGAHDAVIGFHAWLQQLCAEQLGAAHARARAAGMAIGLIGDLAVGVASGGADVWALPDEFARSMRVGAPPDAFNQQGQDWGQPPPLPEAMRASGYRSLREVLRATMSVGGGVRIDHILGFSRLFWIPEDAGPSNGTYVRYPAEELFAVLLLEAHRARAVVIGEDLGTVDARTRRLMRDHGIAGSAVMWFERDSRTPHGRRRAADYPRRALASVTTHDLPTATGWWDGSALRIRHDLGLLDGSIADERARLGRDQATMTALLAEAGLLADRSASTAAIAEDVTAPSAEVRSRVVALHRFLAATRSGLVAVALWDGVGDPRQPNMPGTVDQYPNWRLPLAEPRPDGARPVTVERLRASDAIAAIVDTMRVARG